MFSGCVKRALTKGESGYPSLLPFINSALLIPSFPEDPAQAGQEKQSPGEGDSDCPGEHRLCLVHLVYAVALILPVSVTVILTLRKVLG